MAFIKQEPFSDEQWDQFIQNFENHPDAYIPGHQNVSPNFEDLFQNNEGGQHFEPPRDQTETNVKSEPIESDTSWAYGDLITLGMDTQADGIPQLDISDPHTPSELDEIKTLYGSHSFFAYLTLTMRQGQGEFQVGQRSILHEAPSDFQTRRVNELHQHLAALYPFFEGMRTALKALTKHINPQWELKTPTSPMKMYHGSSLDPGRP